MTETRTEFDPILDNPFTAEARVVAHSISPEGVELISVQEKFWRPVLAERNTHKNQYGNSASSRAIPVEKSLRKFIDEPAYPTSWPAEQPGMQGGAQLTGKDLEDALDLWYGIQDEIGGRISDYLAAHPDKSTRLHKSVLNRLLEHGLWHTRITTATAWGNFFLQRCDADAQPEIRDVALLIREAVEASTPREVHAGEWHLPYVWDDDAVVSLAASATMDASSYWEYLGQVSAARCARTSYETMDGRRDAEEDLNLYHHGLVTAKIATGSVIHWSPLEHVATPDPHNRQEYPLTWTDPRTGQPVTFDTSHLPKVGALVGWRNLRTEVEAEHGYRTFS